MRRTYHINVSRAELGNWRTVDSYDGYDAATVEATRLYRSTYLRDDDAIEVTCAGHTVWGPFVKGSTRYTPSLKES